VKSRALLNESKKSVALPASIGWPSDYGLCGPRNSSGSLAMFTAILQTPSHLSEVPLRRHSRNGGSTHSYSVVGSGAGKRPGLPRQN